MNRARSTAALLAFLAAATLLNGCAGRAEVPVPAPTAPVASSQSQTVTSTESAAPSEESNSSKGSSKNLSAQELARIRAQLDAMQNEIDDLQLPSDDDFNSAASDLY